MLVDIPTKNLMKKMIEDSRLDLSSEMSDLKAKLIAIQDELAELRSIVREINNEIIKSSRARVRNLNSELKDNNEADKSINNSKDI